MALKYRLLRSLPMPEYSLKAKGRYEGFDAIIHKPFDLNG